MDKPIMEFNMSFYDKCSRFISGWLLLILTMSTAGIPPWMALAALYPILTAIASWDPLYAAINVVCNWFTDKVSLKGGKLVLE